MRLMLSVTIGGECSKSVSKPSLQLPTNVSNEGKTMSKSKKLTQRQLAVLDDLFAGKIKEQTILKRHHVPRALYEKWLADERFVSLFERRIEHAYRQSRMILARNASDAAKRLVALTGKDGGETARKACLDIITRQLSAARKTPPDVQPAQDAPALVADVSPETASRLLAALAGQA